MNTLAIIIGRFQPLHVGHTLLIESALQKHETVLVLVGSSDVTDELNPLSFEQREHILQTQYPDSNIMIDALVDMPDDLAWVESITTIIHLLGNYDAVEFYCGDQENDSAIQALKQFQSHLLMTQVDYHCIDRSNVTIAYDGVQTPITATLIRSALRAGRFEEIQRAIPRNIREEIQELFA